VLLAGDLIFRTIFSLPERDESAMTETPTPPFHRKINDCTPPFKLDELTVTVEQFHKS
jgi:hypothetical protein